MKSIYPRALKPGDTIALVAPAGPVNRERIELAISRLEEKGFRIKIYGDLYRSHGYLAGDDVTRASELMAAFADREVAAIFPARGGTGVMRILDMLDYNVIRRNPKILTGFSDITALHAAIQSQTGLVTFHSPNPQDGLGMPDGLSTLSARTFWRAILAENYATFSPGPFELPLMSEEQATIATFAPGVACGRLVGGNLALVCSLVGTPYEIDTLKNILLLEDVGEQPYRIDRFLNQLRIAGKLDDLSGAILGQFTDCEAESGKPSLTLDEIFADYFSHLDIPILQNFPTGHTNDNATLPLGVEVELDASAKTLTILELPVRLE